MFGGKCLSKRFKNRFPTLVETVWLNGGLNHMMFLRRFRLLSFLFLLFYIYIYKIYIYIYNIWDVNVDNFFETKTYCKYLIAYLDKAIRTLVLIMPKISYMLRHLKVKIDIKIVN